MDEARIWNVARTQTEILSTINQQITSGTGLLARWGMNEGAGTTIASLGRVIPRDTDRMVPPGSPGLHST